MLACTPHNERIPLRLAGLAGLAACALVQAVTLVCLVSQQRQILSLQSAYTAPQRGRHGRRLQEVRPLAAAGARAPCFQSKALCFCQSPWRSLPDVVAPAGAPFLPFGAAPQAAWTERGAPACRPPAAATPPLPLDARRQPCMQLAPLCPRRRHFRTPAFPSLLAAC